MSHLILPCNAIKLVEAEQNSDCQGWREGVVKWVYSVFQDEKFQNFVAQYYACSAVALYIQNSKERVWLPIYEYKGNESLK